MESLPSLHTLEIVDSKLKNESHQIVWTKEIFKKSNFPRIKKVAIPLIAHPILSHFPNMEELVCFGHPHGSGVRHLLKSVRGANQRKKTGKIEPVLKSFTLISTWPDQFIAKGT